jgi:hypothetical protein
MLLQVLELDRFTRESLGDCFVKRESVSLY